MEGDVGLNPVASSGEVGLEGVRLANLLRVIKIPRNFEIPSGMLAAGLRYRFALVVDKAGEAVPWLQVNGANLIVQDLALAPRGGGAPVLQLVEARVSDANLDLEKRQVDVAGVSPVTDGQGQAGPQQDESGSGQKGGGRTCACGRGRRVRTVRGARHRWPGQSAFA